MSVHHTDQAAGVTNLRLKFPGEKALLFQGLSLSVRPGEKLLLLGPSGCGKSTLLQVLSGLIPRSMEIPMKCDEVVIPERSGVVFQDPDTQFCMSYADEELAFVLENNCVPREHMPSRIHAALTQVGLPAEPAHRPIQEMSQGMKQRLAIASILAMESDVLFLDEPTALLDEEGTAQVWDTIKRVSEGKTLVIVEHKIDEILEYVDRIVVLSPMGEIIADGTAEQVWQEHQPELSQYGIWYPGVWEEASSPRLGEPGNHVTRNAASVPLMGWLHFRGLRGKKQVIEMEEGQVYAGDWIAVTGRNGAGKSSLLLSMMRLLPTAGVYQIGGIQAGTPEQIAEDIGFVFQNPEFQFVTHLVWDEVEYSLLGTPLTLEQRHTKVERMLQQFGLHELTERHPYQLSLGQKRRLSIATAMIREPKILLLDEPTFGQDARNTFAILDLLESLRASGTAIVMVTHDQAIVRRYCTALWHVDEGSVVHADYIPSS